MADNFNPINSKSKEAGSNSNGTSLSFLKYSGLAFQLLIIIGLFTYAGKWLDSYLSFKFPLFLLIGALVGTIGSIFKVIAELTGKKPND